MSATLDYTQENFHIATISDQLLLLSVSLDNILLTYVFQETHMNKSDFYQTYFPTNQKKSHVYFLKKNFVLKVSYDLSTLVSVMSKLYAVLHFRQIYISGKFLTEVLNTKH